MFTLSKKQIKYQKWTVRSGKKKRSERNSKNKASNGFTIDKV